MRLTYTDLKNQFLRNTNQAGSTDANLIADFQNNLGARYQLIMAKMQDFKTQTQFTSSTVAAQQYYSYPPGTVNVETVVITVGSVNFPLKIINSQADWDQLNAILVQASALPQFIFPRKDDFGIWPIPQAAYTITFNQHQRDRNLLVDDYTGGTVAVTAGSTTLTGTSTTFTSAMVGRWFTVTDTTAYGEGYWYRVTGYTSTTVLTLATPWYGNSASGLTYRIGESPEIPEEGHIILVDGATADFYGGMRKDAVNATWWNNKFYTGDGNNNSRQFGDSHTTAGLIGMINRWSDRSQERIIVRRPKLSPLQYKVWATTLS